ncbi:tautomerase [Mesorhizobium sp. B2-4-2]|uniref:tautomerase family protein n=1 Tax=unclassified Mesorhizobium TaxID=325217 RepID=UPI00112E65B1|nr:MULTISPECIES: tautomerase [unclassified Mesorhizobium]MBZ9919363.1 tautomerase [Mesorhizobium sp. BR1-1-7]MBZ9955574.1 tautomerase [Mesorhizobium sp. BR1-1-15]MBZ9958751.1 tautomerase [Mesorhizobium sp. BR1-1-14]MBZ9972314.1 tautomerase [Mesorhizobium sp. BR1-1-12]TPL46050.1 tautomerase [Mesorhizobium sp. B2-4-4]
MPYLQLDVSRAYPTDVKRELARQLGEIYSRIMQADVRRISIAIRELGEGGLWRCTGEEPYPAALLMCDIRRGRPAEQRAMLAEALVRACMESLKLMINEVNVEFTQHAGDEMYHPMLGGVSDDWSENEASS